MSQPVPVEVSAEDLVEALRAQVNELSMARALADSRIAQLLRINQQLLDRVAELDGRANQKGQEKRVTDPKSNGAQVAAGHSSN